MWNKVHCKKTFPYLPAPLLLQVLSCPLPAPAHTSVSPGVSCTALVMFWHHESFYGFWIRLDLESGITSGLVFHLIERFSLDFSKPFQISHIYVCIFFSSVNRQGYERVLSHSMFLQNREKNHHLISFSVSPFIIFIRVYLKNVIFKKF